jgi:hypothetical protein
VFLASHGVGTAAQVVEPLDTSERSQLIATAGPSEKSKLYRTREYRSIEEGVASFIERSHGTLRPDLSGRATKEVVSVLERDIKSYIAAAYGSELGGTNHKGTDIPEWNVDIKTVTSGQSRLRYGCGCERALGTAEHALVVPYSLEGDLLSIETPVFVPSWHTADIVASSDAEALRRKVVNDEMSAPVAMSQLLNDNCITDPCLHILAALSSTTPITQGAVTLSAVERVWQTRYNHVSGHVPGGSRIRRISAPVPSKVEKLSALRLRNRSGDRKSVV